MSIPVYVKWILLALAAAILVALFLPRSAYT